ncbi:hypothetical protein INT45_001722 [Circinella minor]|uniref:Methyltransferase domain-containing protein n=1 Tax=Circinella minor TaxID=1195481 RepID=A0A8H7VHS2_9FUNG|nr:hypothetical protein INT45_001722 [Circinella minor]
MDQEQVTLQVLDDLAVRQFYTHYVGIDNEDELVRHWQTIRSRLSEYGPLYKCINYYKFVKSRLSSRFYYHELLDMKKQGNQAPIVMDLGCCTGTDLRKLMFDGYPGDKLFGIELNQHYIDCGYDLFRDRQQCPITFITEDIFTITPHTTMIPRAGVIYTGSMIHLFSFDQLYHFIEFIITHLIPGGLFMGTHVVGDITTSITRRGNTKHFIGMQDFKDVLERHQFVDIKFCKEPRQKDPDEDIMLNTYWLSFQCRLG